VKLVTGQDLGGSPCSELISTEQLDQTFTPIASNMVPEEFRDMIEPEFYYVVNASECEGCAVELTIRARSFWLVSDRNNYASLTLDQVGVVSFIRLKE
jgi:hypothetical protein